MEFTEKYEWWRAVFLPFWLGLMFALIAMIPPFSPSFLGIGGAIAAIISTAAFVYWRTHDWRALWLLQHGFPLVLLLLGARGWAHIVPAKWVWLVPLLGAYVLAWWLPASASGVSRTLFREEQAPRTCLGRGCVLAFLALGPAGGIVGASIGMYGSRLLGKEFHFWGFALFGTALALVWSHLVAQSLWDRRHDQ